MCSKRRCLGEREGEKERANTLHLLSFTFSIHTFVGKQRDAHPSTGELRVAPEPRS